MARGWAAQPLFLLGLGCEGDNFPGLSIADQLGHYAQEGSASSFGPQLEANRNMRELVEESLCHCPGSWMDQSDVSGPHEANLLKLLIDKAHHQLGLEPRCPSSNTIERNVPWYRHVLETDAGAFACCQNDLNHYQTSFPS